MHLLRVLGSFPLGLYWQVLRLQQLLYQHVHIRREIVDLVYLLYIRRKVVDSAGSYPYNCTCQVSAPVPTDTSINLCLGYAIYLFIVII